MLLERLILMMKHGELLRNVNLKAHCRDADWINKTIKKKRIWPDSVISLYSEIHEDHNNLVPFTLETKHKGLVITQRPELCFRFQNHN